MAACERKTITSRDFDTLHTTPPLFGLYLHPDTISHSIYPSMGSPDSRPTLADPATEDSAMNLSDLAMASQTGQLIESSSQLDFELLVDPSDLSPSSSLPLPNSTSTIPRLGITITRSHGPTVTATCVAALHAGHRLLDTSQLHNNETQISRAAFLTYQIPRSSVFLSTKILFPKATPDATYASISASVENLDPGDPTAKGHIDLLSIASPHGGPLSRRLLWEALERAKASGIVRDIGVCNYGIPHLEEMKTYANIWPPAVNQLELHPWCQQRGILEYCRANGIVVATYCPLVRGHKVWDETLVGLAMKYQREPNQVLVRYALQKEWVVLLREDGIANPRAVVSNVDVFGWGVDEADMAVLDALDRGAKGAVVRAVPSIIGDGGPRV
jgi:diketogulonate reductase-like aldo/keto reductase